VIRGLERVGGFGGKSDRLAQTELYMGYPDAWKTSLKSVEAARAADLKAAFNTWLADGVAVFEVHPFPKLQSLSKGVDRSKVPEFAEAGKPELPRLVKDKLSNGLTIVLHERHDLPLVQFNLTVNAGYAADEKGHPGMARLTSRLLTGGTPKRNTLQIAEESQTLGAQLRAAADIDSSDLVMSALKTKLDPSLELFSDVLLHPTFPATEFGREQALQLSAIAQEKTQPMTMSMRVLPPLLFGRDHAYGAPFTGSGTTESVKALTREDVARYYQTWFKPNNATLIIAGDTTMAEIKPKLENYLGKWASGSVPEKRVPAVTEPAKSIVYLIDKPDSPQSVILAGTVGPRASASQEVAFETMNNMFGGTFGSRLNLNLREDKHWSYGAFAFMPKTRAQRPYLAVSPVQSDKTRDALVEFRKEITGMLGDRPVTEAELGRFRTEQVLKMAGTRETLAAVTGLIRDSMILGLPDDYYDLYPAKVAGLRVADINDASKTLLNPDRLVWVVIGDRKKIESDIRALNFGEMHVIDADGQTVN